MAYLRWLIGRLQHRRDDQLCPLDAAEIARLIRKGSVKRPGTHERPLADQISILDQFIGRFTALADCYAERTTAPWSERIAQPFRRRSWWLLIVSPPAWLLAPWFARRHAELRQRQQRRQRSTQTFVHELGHHRRRLLDQRLHLSAGVVMQSRRPCNTAREHRSTTRRRSGASSRTSSADPGDLSDPDAGPSSRPRLALVAPLRVVYTYGCLTPEQRGEDRAVEAGR